MAEVGDLFGAALAAANFGGASQADLAVGVPQETVDDVLDAGAANVLYGSSGGLNATGDQFWHQDSPGVPGDAGSFDRFGNSLAPTH